MLGTIFKLFGAAICIVFVVFYAAAAFRRSRLLDKRIKEFKAEQEELRKSGKVIDPYAELASLYSDAEKDRPRPPRNKPSRPQSRIGRRF